MGVLVLKDGFLIFKVCVFACFLVLQGYAVDSPDGDATPGPDSQGISSSSPIMPPSPPDAVFLHPPPSSAPISSAVPPERVKDPIVPVFPPTYLLMPPSIPVTPPVNTSGNTTALAPSVPPGNPEHADPPIPGTPAPFPSPPPGNPEHADPPIPGTPAPFPSPPPGNPKHADPRIRTPAPFPSPPPGNPKHADPRIPGTPAPFPLPPPGNPKHADPRIPGTPAPFPSPSTASPNNPSISPGLSPVSLSPPSHGNGSTEIPVFPVPSPDAVSGISPIMPPTHSVMPEISPSRFPVPAVLPHMPPNMLPGDPSHVQPALPAKPPSILSEPAASPVPSISIPSPPFKSPKVPASPASPPSTSVVRHHYGTNNQSSIAPPLYRDSPPASPKQDPKINNSFYGPPPLKSVSSISPYASASPPSMRQYYLPPSLSQPVPFISPKMSPSGSSPRIPKLPRQPSYQGLPPPPPNEDCVSLVCSEPLTIGPPGTPCVCVLPMQVGLRLSVALYTFFPLVSEFAAEAAIGVFLKSSQVRIMGANVASEDSEKTIVLLDLVPLGEGFDNATSYLMSRRLWQKEVVIDASLFGNYEVLYVRYPGLPPSPPVDVDFVNSDPYNSHGNAAAIKPLGVDVGRKQRKGGPSKSVIAIIILSVSLAVIFGSVIAWFLVFRCRDLCEHESTPPDKLPSSAKSAGIGASGFGSPHSSASLSLPSSIAAYTGSAKTFTSSEIERATENFNEARVIGEGGFGRVYLGVLQDETEVAVKVLKRADQQGGREFLAEVEMLSRLHHRNLVKLTGICTEERTRCLVYELIPNGSVESHLHGIHRQSAPLDWAARLKISLGAARGLAYLHEDSSPRVIHRDFKSSNILLEHDFTPKVSDFGLARTALEEENKHISTRVMGTFGYVAPEYAMTGHLLVKSDVYSYGVVLLELLTGRKPVDMSQPPGQENLVSWVRPLLTSEEGLESIIDPSLGPDFPYDSISKVAAIASMCVQPEVSNRPFMGEVVQALKLVCSDCDETTELGSISFSHEDASFGNTSGHLHHPMRNEFPSSSYDSEVDVERGLSGSYLLDSSTRYVKQDSGSRGKYSSSGPLRTGNTMRLWQKARLLSGGSFSDHSMMFNSWQRSH